MRKKAVPEDCPLSIKENNFNENCKKSIDPDAYANAIPGRARTGPVAGAVYNILPNPFVVEIAVYFPHL